MLAVARFILYIAFIYSKYIALHCTYLPIIYIVYQGEGALETGALNLIEDCMHVHFYVMKLYKYLKISHSFHVTLAQKLLNWM